MRIEKGETVMVKGQSVVIVSVERITTKDLIGKKEWYRVHYRTPEGNTRHFDFEDDGKGLEVKEG